jgi:hypothetical protein
MLTFKKTVTPTGQFSQEIQKMIWNVTVTFCGPGGKQQIVGNDALPILNHSGQEGWEVIEVETYRYSNNQEWFFWLKRPLYTGSQATIESRLGPNLLIPGDHGYFLPFGVCYRHLDHMGYVFCSRHKVEDTAPLRYAGSPSCHIHSLPAFSFYIGQLTQYAKERLCCCA